jgi:hypothetical protein
MKDDAKKLKFRQTTPNAAIPTKEGVGFAYTESGEERRFTVGKLKGAVANLNFGDELDEDDRSQEILKGKAKSGAES